MDIPKEISSILAGSFQEAAESVLVSPHEPHIPGSLCASPIPIAFLFSCQLVYGSLVCAGLGSFKSQSSDGLNLYIEVFSTVSSEVFGAMGIIQLRRQLGSKSSRKCKDPVEIIPHG